MDLSKFGVEVKDDKPKGVIGENLNFDADKFREEYKSDEIERYLPWFMKYQLNDMDDLIMTKEIKVIVEFFDNFKPGKGILLAGSAGSGKTTTLNLLGNNYGYEIFEMNASDTRNKASINESVGIAIKQRSLFADKKLILIDEVDGVSGRDDRGGVAEIAKLVKESKYPVAFTANDKESDKIKALKKVCTYVDFENHSRELLMKISKRIFIKEKIKFDESELKSFIDERSTSDIRGFINDLQASVFEGEFKSDVNLELRDYKKKIEGLLSKIYYSYPEDSYKGTFNTDLSLDDLFLYLEENTPDVYAQAAVINAFNEIGKADVFRGRIRKWQHWRFLVYVNFYLTFGVSTSKDKNVKNINVFKRNNRILKKWIYSSKFNALSSRTRIQKEQGLEPKFIEKLAKLYGTSAKRCRSYDVFCFAYTYRNDLEFREKMDKILDIDDSIRKALLEL